MAWLPLTFLVASLVAGVLGLGVLAGAAGWATRWACVLAVALFAAALAFGPRAPAARRPRRRLAGCGAGDDSDRGSRRRFTATPDCGDTARPDHSPGPAFTRSGPSPRVSCSRRTRTRRPAARPSSPPAGTPGPPPATGPSIPAPAAARRTTRTGEGRRATLAAIAPSRLPSWTTSHLIPPRH